MTGDSSNHMRRLLWGSVSVLLAGGLAAWVCAAAGSDMPDRERVPGAHWDRMPAEQAGFDAGALDAVTEEVGGAGCIVQHGRIVYEWGDTVFRNDVASSIKVVYTFWVLQAVQNGILQSIHDPVADWVPELADLNAELGYKDRGITFAQLMEQVSGYSLPEAPGVAFAYNDFGTGLLWAALKRLSGLPPGGIDELLNGPGMGQALGFEHRPTLLHRNSKDGRIRISVQDLARFGLLFLRNGNWGGQTVLREDLVEQALTPPRQPRLPRTAGGMAEVVENIPSFGGDNDLKDSLGCLGYYWWFNREISPGDGLLLPAAPPDAFMGMGYGGRFCFILMPEQDLEVVWVDIARGESWSPFDEVGRYRVNELLGRILGSRTATDRAPPEKETAAR